MLRETRDNHWVMSRAAAREEPPPTVNAHPAPQRSASVPAIRFPSGPVPCMSML